MTNINKLSIAIHLFYLGSNTNIYILILGNSVFIVVVLSTTKNFTCSYLGKSNVADSTLY